MYTPETSRLFSRWQNPNTGVESLILSERVSPVQKTFYFVNRSFTDDGRYLWVVCMYPPPGGREAVPLLAVVDFKTDELRVYHETQFSVGSSLVDTSTGEVYWINELDLWKRGPRVKDVAKRINRLPKEFFRPPIGHLASHMTFSADRKSVNIDATVKGTSYLGELPLDGSDFKLWGKFEKLFYNHSMFSPTEPDVQMFAHDYWKDYPAEEFDGKRLYHRMWLIRRGEKPTPVLREPETHAGHEWWDPDGKHVWYVHYGVGVKKVNIATGASENLWPGRLSHAYSDQTGRYLIADYMRDPKVSDCIVMFRDTVTGKQVELVNRPPLAPELTQCGHLHPHPQFCREDKYVCYTTTVHDRVDLALANVDHLIEHIARQ